MQLQRTKNASVAPEPDKIGCKGHGSIKSVGVPRNRSEAYRDNLRRAYRNYSSLPESIADGIMETSAGRSFRPYAAFV